MRTLILGGTHHVGRAIVAECVARGDEVTIVNRGNVPAPEGVRSVVADRREPGQLAAALGADEWDLAFDPWSQEPVRVAEAASVLEDRVGHFTYISTRSVYGWPIGDHGDEWHPTVDGDPDSFESAGYAADKRGGEFAAIRSFPGRCLIARPGLISGPFEIVGRLPHWLERFARGGEILAPGRPERPLQHIDARDLARFVRDLAEGGVSDIFDTVSEPGHTTMGSLLSACAEVAGGGSAPELTWVSEEFLMAHDVTGWVDVPFWTPESNELDALHNSNVSKAYAAGLRCRDILDTAAATWEWVQSGHETVAKINREGYLSGERESELLAAWHAGS